MIDGVLPSKKKSEAASGKDFNYEKKLFLLIRYFLACFLVQRQFLQVYSSYFLLQSNILLFLYPLFPLNFLWIFNQILCFCYSFVGFSFPFSLFFSKNLFSYSPPGPFHDHHTKYTPLTMYIPAVTYHLLV